MWEWGLKHGLGKHNYRRSIGDFLRNVCAYVIEVCHLSKDQEIFLGTTLFQSLCSSPTKVTQDCLFTLPQCKNHQCPQESVQTPAPVSKPLFQVLRRIIPRGQAHPPEFCAHSFPDRHQPSAVSPASWTSSWYSLWEADAVCLLCIFVSVFTVPALWFPTYWTSDLARVAIFFFWSFLIGKILITMSNE